MVYWDNTTGTTIRSIAVCDDILVNFLSFLMFVLSFSFTIRKWFFRFKWYLKYGKKRAILFSLTFRFEYNFNCVFTISCRDGRIELVQKLKDLCPEPTQHTSAQVRNFNK